MVTTLPSAKITLSCPLWACDFDPHDANQLVVGGGGGAGRHGVGNKIVRVIILALLSPFMFIVGRTDLLVAFVPLAAPN
jgi:hypothetical protein